MAAGLLTGLVVDSGDGVTHVVGLHVASNMSTAHVSRLRVSHLLHDNAIQALVAALCRCLSLMDIPFPT